MRLRGDCMSAAEILRAEYGASKNMMTPTRMRPAVLLRHPETGETGAAEVSMGDGIRMREHETRRVTPRVYAVTVVWRGADGATRRTMTDDPHGSRIFQDEAPEAEWWTARHDSEAYAAALAYVRELGGRV